MRGSAIFVLTTAVMLAPVAAAADPAQLQPVPTTAAATSAPATAQSNPAPASARPVPPGGETVVVTGKAGDDDELDRIVCHAEPPKTGSRLGGERECFTQRQWNDREKESQRILDGYQTRSLSGGYGR